MSINGFEGLFQLREEVFERIIRCYKMQHGNDQSGFQDLYNFNDIEFCDRLYDLELQFNYGTSPFADFQPDDREMTVQLEAGASSFNSSKLRLGIPVTGVFSSQFSDPHAINVSFPGEVMVKLPMRQEGKQIILKPSQMQDTDVDFIGGPSADDFKQVISLCLNDQAASGPDGRLIDRQTGLIDIPAGTSEEPRPTRMAYEMIFFDEDHPLEVTAIDEASHIITVVFDMQLNLQFLPPGIQDDVATTFKVAVRIPYVENSLPDGRRIWILRISQLDSTSFALPAQEFSDELFELASYIVNELFGLDIDVSEANIGALVKRYTQVFTDTIAFDLLADVNFTVPDFDRDAAIEEILNSFRRNEDIVALSFEGNDFVSSISPKIFTSNGLSIGFNGSESPANSLTFLVPSEQDFVFALDESVIQPELDVAAEDSRQKFNSESSDARINSMSINMGNQEFRVRGNGKIEIDCWPDPSLSFDGEILVVGVSPDGQLQLSLSDDFDVDVDEDCLTAVIIVLSTLTFGLIGLTISLVLSQTLFKRSGESPDSDDFDGLEGVGMKLSDNDDTDVDIRILFQDVVVSPSRMTFSGLIITPCDIMPLGLRTIQRVQWNDKRSIIAVELAAVRGSNWQYRWNEIIQLMETGQIGITNAQIVNGKTRKYLRSLPNDSTEDNLDNLPKFRFSRSF